MKNEIEQAYQSLPKQTKKALEEMGITFDVYSQMIELLQQVEQQTGALTTKLNSLAEIEDQEIDS
jgi:hypothetical protein